MTKSGSNQPLTPPNSFKIFLALLISGTTIRDSSSKSKFWEGRPDNELDPTRSGFAVEETFFSH